MGAIYKYMIVVGIIAFLGGCASSAGRLPEPGVGHAVLIDAYTMDVGDQVNVTVWKNPDLSVAAPVRPDGKIAVPLVGDIMAAGRTPEDLAAEIEKRLSDYIKEPVVTVVLTGLQGQSYLSRISVTGAVGSNTALTYHQGMTVLDAILSAGSVSPYADANHTKLHRHTAEGIETYDIRVKDILENGDMRTNVYLLPGDVITVPESLF